MEASNDSCLMDYVLFLKNTQQETLIDMFIKDYLGVHENNGTRSRGYSLDHPDDVVALNTTTQITWRYMQYLWKQYMESKNLPNIIFQQTLKPILITKLNEFYREPHDSFIGICCKHIPMIRKFMAFWEETVHYDADDQNSEFEIGELCLLMKKWCEMHEETGRNLNERQMLDLISYFFPNVEIEKDKYLYRIRCSLWNKQMDVQMALENLKVNLQMRRDPHVEITLYDAYIHYCKFASGLHNNYEQIVSKSFFEKYVTENIEELDFHYISNESIMA